MTVATCAPAVLKWLRDLVRSSSFEDAGCQGVMQAYLLAVICSDLGAGEATTEMAAASRIGGLTLEAMAGCGGELVLLAALALQRRTRELPEAVREYLDIAQSAALSGTISASVGYLLNELGIDAALPREALAIDARSLLGAARPVVRRGLSDIESATLHGTLAVDPPCGLVPFLNAVAVERLQRYDLEFAASAMRARYYLSGGEDLASTMFRAFVAGQQDSDGSIGIFAHERELLSAAPAAVDAAMALSLPTTLSVLRALAEMDDDGYRMYRDVGTR